MNQWVSRNPQNDGKNIPDTARLERPGGTAGVQTRSMRRSLERHSADKVSYVLENSRLNAGLVITWVDSLS